MKLKWLAGVLITLVSLAILLVALPKSHERVADQAAEKVILSYIKAKGLNIRPNSPEYDRLMKGIVLGEYTDLTGQESIYVSSEAFRDQIINYAARRVASKLLPGRGGDIPPAPTSANGSNAPYPPPLSNALEVPYAPPPDVYLTLPPTHLDDSLYPMIDATQRSQVEAGRAMKMTAAAPSGQPEPTPYIHPYLSEEDLVQAVADDPFFNDDCFRSGVSRQVYFVRSLNERDDLYMLPYYKGTWLCGIAVFNVKPVGVVAAESYSSPNGATKFPAIDAKQAMREVESYSGKTVTELPQLVYQQFFEMPTTKPLWQVFTTDGATYYVCAFEGIEENGILKTFILVKRDNELHLLR